MQLRRLSYRPAFDGLFLVLTIELKQPGMLRRGYVRITPLSNEPYNLKIAGKKAFRVASNLMMQFEPNRVKVDR